MQSLNAIPFINIREPGISMPIGISFYTFQAMSYVIDTYRDDEKRPGSFFDVMLYICLFPQLVAGPIVKYNSVREQLRDRQVGAEEISAGIRRFIIGLSKKMLIANVMAAAVDKMFALDMAQLDTASAWVGAVCYLFQIYFDFSGYSDMAVGMGKMFGFTFPENFDSVHRVLCEAVLEKMAYIAHLVVQGISVFSAGRQQKGEGKNAL